MAEKLVCQAGVALGALGRTSEGHSERSIQNSNCLCDRGRRGAGGEGAVVNGARTVEPLNKCDGDREVWWGWRWEE